MTTTPSPGEDSSPTSAMPTSVRVAVIVMAVMAGLLLVNAALAWYTHDDLIDRLVREAGVSRAEAGQIVLVAVAPHIVLGALLALAAWFLPRARGWARWVGLATAGVLGLQIAFAIVTAGGITIPSLLLLVLCLAAVTSLAARTTRDFVGRTRARA